MTFIVCLLLEAISVATVFLVGPSHAQPRFQPTAESTRQAILRGDLDQALSFYETEAATAEARARFGDSSQRNWEIVSAAYREAGRTAMLIGELHKAILYGEKAVEAAELTKRAIVQLTALRRLRQAERAARNFTKAKELLNRQIPLINRLSPLGQVNWRGFAYEHLAEDLVDDRMYNDAVDALNKSLDLNKEILDNFDVWDTIYEQNPIDTYRTHRITRLHMLGRVYYLIGGLNQAVAQYSQALKHISDWNLQFIHEHHLHLGLGRVELQRGNLSLARGHFERGFAVAQHQGIFDGMISAAGGLGRVQASAGKFDEAVRNYEEAIGQIERVRSSLLSHESRQSYFGGEMNVYVGIVDALFRDGRTAEAFTYGERSRARAFLDGLGSKLLFLRANDSQTSDLANLKGRVRTLTAATVIARGKDERAFVSKNLAEAENLYAESLNAVRRRNPEQATLLSVEPLTLQEVQRLLEPQQVLLQYFVAAEKTYLWAVAKQDLRAFELPLSKKDIALRVQSLRAAISELRPVKEIQKIARDLYSELVAPAQTFTRNNELIIVPHDVLHYLPFQALYSPEGRYLVEDHSISYLSSASLMQFTKAKRKAVGQKVLAVGNPNFDASKISLPMAELEAGEIRRLYPQSAVLARGEATEEKVKSLSSSYDVLHFATHAELNKDDPLSSAVLLSKGGDDDGRLEVREIFGMDLKASLVVLSACETALGALSSGDELVGLTRAFIYAGTPSVIASLWKVDDSSTGHLMSSFYRNLKSKTKVESLRRAQLDMIRGKTNAQLLAQRGVGGVGKLGQTSAARSSNAITTTHPYFWAPFILVGDGR